MGPHHFSTPDQVIHQDFVYLPATQPLVHVRSVDLEGPDGEIAVIRDDRYVIDFSATGDG